MAENSGAGLGRPIETVVTELSDTPEIATGEQAVESKVSDEQLLETVKRMRVMALGLSMTSARTGDGLYAAWAYSATATAGIAVQLLQERNSPLLEVLQEEDIAEENRSGTREIPLR
ncbi:MAG: hypothetical protein ACHQT5_01160 [Candidatus Saccharimonadales bacterium]